MEILPPKSGGNRIGLKESRELRSGSGLEMVQVLANRFDSSGHRQWLSLQISHSTSKNFGNRSVFPTKLSR